MSRFHSAVMQLSRMSGKDFEQTIKAEMAAVLKNAQRSTIKASKGKIRSHIRNQQFMQIDLGEGKKTYFLGNKFSREDWRKITDRQDRKEAKRVAARGLASRMWVHIANQLGVSLKGVPAYVSSAVSGKGGDQRQKVGVFQSGSGNKYQIGFINSLTDSNVGAKAGLAFRGALNARANFFGQSMKLAAKGIIRRALDRYPGLGRVS
jgi:hypothetical protein